MSNQSTKTKPWWLSKPALFVAGLILFSFSIYLYSASRSAAINDVMSGGDSYISMLLIFKPIASLLAIGGIALMGLAFGMKMGNDS